MEIRADRDHGAMTARMRRGRRGNEGLGNGNMSRRRTYHNLLGVLGAGRDRWGEVDERHQDWCHLRIGVDYEWGEGRKQAGEDGILHADVWDVLRSRGGVVD